MTAFLPRFIRLAALAVSVLPFTGNLVQAAELPDLGAGKSRY